MHTVPQQWKLAVALVLAVLLAGGVLFTWLHGKDEPAYVHDEAARQALEQRFSIPVQALYREVGTGRSIIHVGESKRGLELYGVPDEKNITGLALVRDPAQLLTSEVAAVTGTDVERAVVRLPKHGSVGAIARCDNYDPLMLTCSEWTLTDIPFNDYGDYIEFEVEHFTGYGGVTKAQTLYARSTTSVSETTATPALNSTQDGTLNTNVVTMAQGSLHTFMNASAANVEGRLVRTTDTITFSSYWTAGSRVNTAYATFKLYAGNTLICQHGNDNTGGSILPGSSSSGLVTGSCSPSTNITVPPNSALHYVVTVYPSSVSGGPASSKEVTLQWDTATANTSVRIEYMVGTDINATTNASSYLQGQTVNVSGTFFWMNGTSVPGRNVTVEFVDPSGAVASTTNGTTASTGFYNRTYTLASNALPGSWQVNVTGWIDGTTYAANSTNFTVTDPYPQVSGLTVSPNPTANGSTVTVSAAVTDNNAVSTVKAELLYPNGTAWQNVTLTGPTPYTGVFTSPQTPGGPWGNYTARIWANDSSNQVNNTESARFIVYPVMNKSALITTNGDFSDWSGTHTVSDASDDAQKTVINNTWIETGSSPPSARVYPALTFDRNINRTLLHGGRDSTADCDSSGKPYCNGTYSLNTTDMRWYKEATVTFLPGFGEMDMVFEPNINLTILFGGYDASLYYGDTIAYNASNRTWFQRAPATRPDPRSQHAMTFDKSLNMILLYGGSNTEPSCDGSGINFCNGTWAYNATDNNWMSIAVNSPPPLTTPILAFDDTLNRTVLWGGYNGTAYLSDTWIFNTTDRRWYNVSAANPPQGREFTQGVYDEQLGMIVLFGGYTGNFGNCNETGALECNGTWAYNSSANAWIQLNSTATPNKRHNVALVFDESINKTLVFGGYDSAGNCDGSGDVRCNGTYFLNWSGAERAPELDITNVSLTNTASSVFAYLEASEPLSGQYRIFFGNASASNRTSPSGAETPIAFNKYAQYDGSQCTVYTSAGQAEDSCNVATSADRLELEFSLSTLGASIYDTLNVTIEAAAGGSGDFSPDKDSFISYTVADPAPFIPPTVNDLSVLPNPGENGSIVTITADVTDNFGVDTVKAELLYPNGTAWQNLTLAGSNPYTAAFTSPSSPLGNYTVRIWANDTHGNVANDNSTGFSPYVTLSQRGEDVVIDESLADWLELLNFTDPVDGGGYLIGEQVTYTGVTSPATGTNATYGTGPSSICLNGYCGGVEFTTDEYSNMSADDNNATTVEGAGDFEVSGTAWKNFHLKADTASAPSQLKLVGSTSYTGNKLQASHTIAVWNYSAGAWHILQAGDVLTANTTWDLDNDFMDGSGYVHVFIEATGNDIDENSSITTDVVLLDMSTYQSGFDIRAISASNNNTHSSFFLQLENDYSSTQEYRVFIATDAAGGNSSSPSGASTPVAYDYYLELASDTCNLYNRSGVAVGSCSAATASNTLELAAVLDSIGATVDDTINLSFEIQNTTASVDFAPDRDSFVSYTIAPESTEPPIISNVQNTSITLSSANITWSTDSNANSSVRYGTTNALLGGSNSTVSTAKIHSRHIYGLQPDTLYYYNVTSCNAYGCNTSGPYNFTTDYVRCGIISENVVLTRDLSATGDCLIVSGNNIVVDGRGFSITGPGSGTGINVSHRTNTTITNVTLENFTFGVQDYQSNGTIVEESVIIDAQFGIYLDEALNAVVQGNNVTNSSGHAIYLHANINTTVRRNAIQTADIGVFVFTNTNTTVENNTIENVNRGVSGGGFARYNIIRNASIGIFAADRAYGNRVSGATTCFWIVIPSSNSSSDHCENVSVAYDVGVIATIENAVVNISNTAFLIQTGGEVTIRNSSIVNTNSSGFDLDMRQGASIFLHNTTIGRYNITTSTGQMNVENEHGALNFTETINGTGSRLHDDIQLGSNFVAVNSSQTGLDKPANITFYDLSWQFEPVIERDGAVCSPLVCEVLDYSSGTLLFNVTGFSNYTSKGNTQLNISDETDTLVKYVGEQIFFYANYTRKNNGNPISGAGIFCNITEDSGGWSPGVNMTYNATSQLYEHNRSFAGGGTFTFEVTCDGSVSGWEVFTLQDDFTVTPLSNPPVFSGAVNDSSNRTDPTLVGSNVTFTGRATDPDGDDWRLLVCNSTSTLGGSCVHTTFCQSGLVGSGSASSCQFNTSSSPLENYSWFAFACDNNTVCSAYNDTNSPFHVNHYPQIDTISISPGSPNATNTLSCAVATSDTDMDLVTLAYAWYLQDEGTGGYSAIPGQTGSTLAPGNFDSGDTVICGSTPTDEHGLAGPALNSSAVAINAGVLQAGSSLADFQVYRTQTATLQAQCTVTDGNSTSVSFIVQDNQSGTYAQTPTAPSDVYTNQSSQLIGPLSGSSPLYSITIYTQAAGNYSFRVQCQAADTAPTVANSTPQTLEVVLDTTPPVISNIDVVSITATSARVTWSTDDSSDSLVDYGLTAALGSSVFDPSDGTGHSVLLISLDIGTLHYFNVTSCNIDNYCSTAGPNTFTTLEQLDLPSSIQKGYCTAVVVEQGPNYVEGYVSKGDIVEFYCESPNEVREREEVEITLLNKNRQLRREITSPGEIYGSQVVVYP